MHKSEKVLRRAVLKRVRSLFKVVGFQRGVDHEDRVVRVFSERTPDVPEWFRSIKPANMRQDFNEGIDFVIESDVGILFLQVKSSAHQAQKFRQGQASRKYRRYIALVVLDDDSISDECVRSRVISALSKIRNVFVERREEAIRSSLA